MQLVCRCQWARGDGSLFISASRSRFPDHFSEDTPRTAARPVADAEALRATALDYGKTTARWALTLDSRQQHYERQQPDLGPTVPTFWTSNPAYAQVQNEHVWQTAWAEIIQDRATPQAAAEKAFKRVEEIFAKFPITQT